MRAYALAGADGPAALLTIPEPDLGPRGARVAIRAASVNGFDVFQAGGHLTGMMEHRFPTVIGRDLAGIVEAIGSDVTDVAVGDEVIAFLPSQPPLQRGSYAERVTADDLVLARKPAGVAFEQAAGVPLAGSAALDLLDAVDVGAGDTLLVVGATGGVGHLVVQLAVARGATVIATARPDEEAFVRDLGAAGTVDYTAGSVADAVRARYPDGITALIDLVSQQSALTDLGSIVHPGGRVATLLGAADVDAFASRGVTAANVNAAPTTDKLERLAGLVESGALRIHVQEVYPLHAVEDALDAFRQGTRGKLVLRVQAERAT